MPRSFFFFLLLLPISASAELTITFGGDMNFNTSRQGPRAEAGLKHGKPAPYKELFAGIKPYVDGDLNFANIETVISERANLPDTGGEFVFVGHPNAMVAAIQHGFNLFSVANNHVGDHGLSGMEDTLDNMEDLSRRFGINYSGLGANREKALTPNVFEVRTPSGNYRIAFLAITGVSNTDTQAKATRIGTIYLRDPKDYRDALSRMAAVRADYKILSIHGGREGQTSLDAGQQSLYERALQEGDIDLILGHHPHRVRPVQKIGHKLIFFSLGNYLMLGASDLGTSNPASDFGLLGKLHLEWDPSLGRLVAQAGEAIPLFNMHRSPQAFGPRQAAARIDALNALGRRELGAKVAYFQIDPRSGFGKSCLGERPGRRGQEICEALERFQR